MTNLEYIKNHIGDYELMGDDAICVVAYCAKHSVDDCDGCRCCECEFDTFKKCIDFLLQEHKELVKLTQLEYDLLTLFNEYFVFGEVPFLRKLKKKGHYKGLNDPSLTVKKILENHEIVPDDYFKEAN